MRLKLLRLVREFNLWRIRHAAKVLEAAERRARWIHERIP